jgi:hypothetical protein
MIAVHEGQLAEDSVALFFAQPSVGCPSSATRGLYGDDKEKIHMKKDGSKNFNRIIRHIYQVI